MLPGGDPVCAPQAAGKAEANHLQPSQRKWPYEPKDTDVGDNLKTWKAKIAAAVERITGRWSAARPSR